MQIAKEILIDIYIGLLHGYGLIKRGFKSRLGWRPLGAIINILKSDFRSFFK